MNKTLLTGLLALLLTACGGGSSRTPASGDSVPSIEPPPVEVDPRCLSEDPGPNWPALTGVDCPLLSHYHLFDDPRNPRVDAAAPGLMFAPASGLFSDHANKYRFLFLPEGASASYREKYGLQFPVGTVLVKTFALPVSESGGDDRLMETRLLIHRESGWVGLPFAWQADGKDAQLARIGKAVPTWVMVDGIQQEFTYLVPDVLTCRKCHQGRIENEVMTPLGTTVRQLNHEMDYPDGAANQLAYWQQRGLLNGAPDAGQWPRAVDWHDQSESLTLRSKSYLDSNCSHCHSDVGSGALSGLRLEYWRDETRYEFGICNPAQGYYGGEYSLTFDIIPGDDAQSVLPYRLGAERSTHTAKDMMPPLGRSLADHDAVAMIRAWINAMPAQPCVSAN